MKNEFFTTKNTYQVNVSFYVETNKDYSESELKKLDFLFTNDKVGIKKITSKLIAKQLLIDNEKVKSL